jgi:hypothetical protein
MVKGSRQFILELLLIECRERSASRASHSDGLMIIVHL